jgi:hypothetical protein
MAFVAFLCEGDVLAVTCVTLVPVFIGLERGLGERNLGRKQDLARLGKKMA